MKLLASACPDGQEPPAMCRPLTLEEREGVRALQAAMALDTYIPVKGMCTGARAFSWLPDGFDFLLFSSGVLGWLGLEWGNSTEP
jgi:hypothetical protein